MMVMIMMMVKSNYTRISNGDAACSPIVFCILVLIDQNEKLLYWAPIYLFHFIHKYCTVDVYCIS